jgi:DNA-binding CsgD family transcriptional regulator
MGIHSNEVEQLLELIDTVYEAALEEGHWTQLAPQIARTFKSTSTTLQVQRVGHSSHILSMTDNVRARIDAYQEHFWQRDIWVERAARLIGMSKVGTSRDMVSDSEFQETEFYRDWCRHLDVFYVVGAVFPSGPGNLGVLGIHRPRCAGAYEEDDKYRASRFLPHLQRALRVREHLGLAARERQMSLEVLYRSQTGILLVTADASIMFANRQAESILASGMGLRSRNGRLAATGEAENRRLLASILEANCFAGEGQPADGLMAIRRPHQPSLSLLVAPFRRSLPGEPSAGAIVFVRDPAQVLSIAASLRTLFRFTPTEARIAQALLNGKTLAQIAALNGANLQTVRKQIKNILAKTGTRRQVECVALMLRSIATLARD